MKSGPEAVVMVGSWEHMLASPRGLQPVQPFLWAGMVPAATNEMHKTTDAGANRF